MMRVRKARGRHVGYCRGFAVQGLIPRKQRAMLKAAGCNDENIHWGYGAQGGRLHELELAMVDARPGDLFVVPTLACFPSLKRAAAVMSDLHAQGIGFVSLMEKLDTRVRHGEDLVRWLAHLAEFNRDILRESTLDGLAIARASGHIGGRRRVLSEMQRASALHLIAGRHLSMAEIARRLGVSRSSLYNAGLKFRKKQKPPMRGG
jgi:DNA invertase Pin-like site-specific DNA recombinase